MHEEISDQYIESLFLLVASKRQYYVFNLSNRIPIQPFDCEIRIRCILTLLIIHYSHRLHGMERLKYRHSVITFDSIFKINVYANNPKKSVLP